MTINVTDKELKYMIESNARDIATLLVERRGMNISDALDTLYNSDTYKALKNPNTGFYFQSPLYIYDFLDNEIKYGKIQ